jgi:hypothetical protein
VIPRLLPPALSLLVLGAHFFRGGAPVVSVLLLVVLSLLALPRWWAARLVQVVLVLGTIEWIMTLLHLAFWRVAGGEPIARLTLILGAVAAFTLASSLVFRTERLRAFYGLGRTAPSA